MQDGEREAMVAGGAAQGLDDPLVADDEQFHRREWRLQQLGWALLAGLVALAALGLFGDGPLSSAQARAGDLAVQHERFARDQSRQLLRVRVGPGHEEQDDGLRVVRVLLGGELLAAAQVDGVQPEPVRTTTGRDAVAFAFAVHEPRAPLDVRFTLRGDAPGRVRGQVALADGTRVVFSQLLYP